MLISAAIFSWVQGLTFPCYLFFTYGNLLPRTRSEVAKQAFLQRFLLTFIPHGARL